MRVSRALRWIWAIALAASLSARADSSDASLEGIWGSIGYGTILQIRNGLVDIYDINRVVCLKHAERTPLGEDVFREPVLSAAGQLLTTRSAIGLTTIRYARLNKLPALCTRKVRDANRDANDGLYNFDAFWSWFDEQYAFFERRGIDWSQVRQQYRPKITKNTSQQQLREIFTSILREFQDAHVSLSGSGFLVNSGIPPLFARWFEDYQRGGVGKMSLDDFAKTLTKTYLRLSWDRHLDLASVQDVSLNTVTATAGNGRIGYLLVTAESGYSPVRKLAADQAAALAELDQDFRTLHKHSALILDMRINFGGHDDIALALAGLLTDQERPGLSKCTRSGEGYTPVQRTVIHPRAAAFTGPVVILSSPYNVSAGENFMMMAKDLPNVLIIGDRTAGVHSDTLDKTLPNGWEISISNEAFVAPDGTMYETVGVPPDLLVPYYPEEVRASGIDPALEKAIQLLSSARATELALAAKRSGARGVTSPCH